MNKRPKVTIVTVCYNAEKEIEATILSVLYQTYPNIEYIVVDGNSKDQTIGIIKKYENRIDRWISEPDKGIFDAMNKAICMATGDWINFMNAGDLYVDKFVLEKMFNDIIDDNVGFVYGDALHPDGRKMLMVSFMENPNKYKGMGICHQSVFVRMDLARKYKFDQSFRVSADYNMIYSIYSDGYGYKYVKVPVAIYEGGGYSAKMQLLRIEEQARITDSIKDWKYLKERYNYIIRHKILRPIAVALGFRKEL